MATEEKRGVPAPGSGAGRPGSTGGDGKTAGAAPGAARGTAAPKRQDRRPDLIRQRREERLRYHERERRRRQYLRLGMAAVAVLLVAALAFGVFNWARDREGNAALERVQTYEGTNVNQGHVEGVVSYEVQPPVGGDHNAVWQNCGFYAQPINNENGVHSLEHGAVWITYRPDLAPDQVEKLRALAEEESYILVSPYPDLKAPIVLSAWSKQLTVDSADDPGVDAFIDEYRQNRDTTPELGASCDGGTTATKR